ncbi:Solute carrier family 35 member E1 [Sarcoptes scabiei]|uniref:Solute carrier family 35 member E1 n=1 Tax=Sarcoptes scabiei TaxID=52283 RepID=A0A131ZTR0_SARSC|nr:Solute carrier family 35 member E1 [Sarcoptes scabiei]KPL97565.1 solute carrier family 35-like protein 1 [Sarcoptes scabiei]
MAKVSYIGPKIVILCLLWYVTSAANNVIGKLILQSFPYPTTITLFQFLSITLYSLPSLRCIVGPSRHLIHMTWTYYFHLIIPLAFGKFFASLTSHISLWAVPVSYAHTVKASMPLFVVILSRLILGERQTIKVYFSLIPIIVGVFIASVTELEFNMTGLFAALFSIFIFSLQNIYSKKVLKETSIHHLHLLFILAKHALLMFIPFWAYYDLPRIIAGDHQKQVNIDSWTIGAFLFLDGLCNYLQNVIAFTMLSLVTPLTYSVCNASKRIAVISFSIFLLKNPVTPTNIFGMFLAIFGVFYYNKAKLERKNKPLLPTVSKTDLQAQFVDNVGLRKNRSDRNLLLRYINDNDYNQDYLISKPIFIPKSENHFSNCNNNQYQHGTPHQKNYAYSSDHYNGYLQHENNHYHHRNIKTSNISDQDQDHHHRKIDMFTI